MASVLEVENAFTADEIMQWKYEQREKFLHDQASRDGAIARAEAALKEAQEEIKEKDEALSEQIEIVKEQAKALDEQKEIVKEQAKALMEMNARLKELEALLAQTRG